MQVDMHSKIPCEYGRYDLEDELNLGWQTEFVINDTQRYENGERQEYLQRYPAGFAEPYAVSKVGIGDGDGEEGHHNGDAATAREFRLVDMAVAWFIRHA